MRITMIGHSTVLIETAGKRILTDPWLSSHGHVAYRRVAPPAMSREELRDVDVVLQSHAHFDHVDRPFLRALPEGTTVLGPKRMLLPFSGLHGNLRRVELWQVSRFDELTITAVPAAHIAVTNGFVIQSEGKSVYFAADTYFRPFMAELGKRFVIDVALMPVTTFRIPMTMGERSAVRAAEALKPKTIIPIHLGIQPRSPLMRTSQTPEGFERRLAESGSKASVVMLRNGDSHVV